MGPRYGTTRYGTRRYGGDRTPPDFGHPLISVAGMRGLRGVPGSAPALPGAGARGVSIRFK